MRQAHQDQVDAWIREGDVLLYDLRAERARKLPRITRFARLLVRTWQWHRREPDHFEN